VTNVLAYFHSVTAMLSRLHLLAARSDSGYQVSTVQQSVPDKVLGSWVSPHSVPVKNPRQTADHASFSVYRATRALAATKFQRRRGRFQREIDIYSDAKLLKTHSIGGTPINKKNVAYTVIGLKLGTARTW